MQGSIIFFRLHFSIFQDIIDSKSCHFFSYFDTLQLKGVRLVTQQLSD